jgi:hypothetical protein
MQQNNPYKCAAAYAPEDRDPAPTSTSASLLRWSATCSESRRRAKQEGVSVQAEKKAAAKYNKLF